MVECLACGGEGGDWYEEPDYCIECDGEGYLDEVDEHGDQIMCDDCMGVDTEYYEEWEDCDECGGTGEAEDLEGDEIVGDITNKGGE